MPRSLRKHRHSVLSGFYKFAVFLQKWDKSGQKCFVSGTRETKFLYANRFSSQTNSPFDSIFRGVERADEYGRGVIGQLASSWPHRRVSTSSILIAGQEEAQVRYERILRSKRSAASINRLEYRLISASRRYQRWIDRPHLAVYGMP